MRACFRQSRSLAQLSGRDNRHAMGGWRAGSPPTNSPPPGSCPACPLARSTDAPPRPTAFLASQSRCHPRSRRPPVRSASSPPEHAHARFPERLRHSRVHPLPNEVATGACAGCFQAPDAPPSAPRSCARPAATARRSRLAMGHGDQRALRLSPVHPCMPQSVFPVGLARTAYPQNNSTTECFLFNTVVLAVCRRTLRAVPVTDGLAQDGAQAFRRHPARVGEADFMMAAVWMQPA